MSFPDRLLARMKDLGLNQAAVAKRAGISAMYVNDLLRGRRDSVSVDVARRLAAALDCDPVDLDPPVRVLVPYSVAMTVIVESPS